MGGLHDALIFQGFWFQWSFLQSQTFHENTVANRKWKCWHSSEQFQNYTSYCYKYFAKSAICEIEKLKTRGFTVYIAFLLGYMISRRVELHLPRSLSGFLFTATKNVIIVELLVFISYQCLSYIIKLFREADA